MTIQVVIKSPAVATKQEIDLLKKEIRELYPAYHTRRLELGMKLIQLQELLSHHGKGTFIEVVEEELKIPKSTVYDLIEYAREEIRQFERSSGNRTNKNDEDVDFAELGETLLTKLEKENKEDRVTRMKRRTADDYNRQVYFKFIFPPAIRIKVIKARTILEQHEVEYKALAMRIGREIINAAAKFKKTSDR